MADYYPLLAKAVAGLPNSTPETRGAIYERARKALLGQLRRLEPPVPEADIDRESQALEVAVARLEAEFGSPVAAAGAMEPLPETAPVTPAASLEPPPEAPRVEPGSEALALDRPAAETAARIRSAAAASARPPLFFKVRRDQGRASDASAKPSGQSRNSAPPFGLMPPHSGLNRDEAAASEPPNPSAEAGEVEPLSARDFGAQDLSAQEFAASEIGSKQHDVQELAGGPAAETPAATSPQPVAPGAKSRMEAQRPFAPQPAHAPAAPKRLWIVGAIVGVLVALVAIAAIELRDRPEDLERQKAALQAAPNDAGASGKIVDRIGAGASPSEAPAARASEGVAADDAHAAKTAAESAAPPVAVARRAALLVEAPEEPNKMKTFLGAVVWRVDNVSNGPGEPLSLAVRADIDIPEEKLQASMTFQKNLDSTLPATHTMKLQFMQPPDGPLGNVQQISVPQMRREDVANGDALKGVPVPIMDNSFLVGLSRGNSEAANLDLLRTREWIDVPMLLSNGRVAKLTFEKGPSGQRAFDDALASWQTQ